MVTFARSLSKIINQCLIGLVNIYQYLLSPFLGHRCRFYPSCSSYAKEALQQFSIVKALYLIVKRLIKCHPGHPGGVDEISTR